MGRKINSTAEEVMVVDIAHIESQLPPKRKRSHHELVQLKHIHKSFIVGQSNVLPILKDIDINLYSGEFAIVYGPSGCGKSTFLHTLLGLEKPTSGEVFLRGQSIYTMPNDERTKLRREKIGMVFQQSNWIKSLNVEENVCYPLWLSGLKEDQARKRAMDVLKEVGMEKYWNSRPLELSGGQQQKVALARALSTDPWIIIADEPTGNLDTKSGEEIITLLARLNREMRRMILMVTHDMSFLPIGTRRIGMKDGRIISDNHD